MSSLAASAALSARQASFAVSPRTVNHRGPSEQELNRLRVDFDRQRDYAGPLTGAMGGLTLPARGGRAGAGMHPRLKRAVVGASPKPLTDTAVELARILAVMVDLRLGQPDFRGRRPAT